MGIGEGGRRERGIVRGFKGFEDLPMNGCGAVIWWRHFTFLTGEEDKE